MKKTMFLLVIIGISAYSCKKKVDSQASNATIEALQGNWVQDSSWTYTLASQNNQTVEINGVPETFDQGDSIVSNSNYDEQKFVVKDSKWTNVTSNWSQDLKIFDNYMMVGGTRFEIDKLTYNRFVLTLQPQEGVGNNYTRFFSR